MDYHFNVKRRLSFPNMRQISWLPIIRARLRRLQSPVRLGEGPRKDLPMAMSPDVAGTAALAIVESLLLCLGDKKILNERKVVAILTDAAAAHHNAIGETDEDATHLKVATLIDSILKGGNSVRHPHK